MAQAAYPPAMDEQSLAAGIFGLATRGMCGLRCRQRSRWALTPPFHPCRNRRRLFSVTCRPDVAAGFPLGNAMLFVARTFLFMLAHRATDLISVFCKVTEIFPDVQIGRANSDTFDGENVGLIHASVSFLSPLSVFIYFQNLILTVFVQCCRFLSNMSTTKARIPAGVQREESTQRW